MEKTVSRITNNSLFNDVIVGIVAACKLYGVNANQIQYMALKYIEDDALLYEQLDYLERTNKLLVTKKEVGELYDLGFIDSTWRNGSDYPDEPKLTDIGKNVIKVIYMISDQWKVKKDNSSQVIKLGSELCEAYPTFWDRAYPTQSFKATYDTSMKKIEGRDQLYQYYYNLIDGDESVHREIIKKIEWAKKQNAPDNTIPRVPQIRQSIMNFVVTKAWKEIKMTGGDKTQSI